MSGWFASAYIRHEQFQFPYFMHRSTPKVIKEYVLQWRMGTKIAILLDRRNIVKDEATIKGVVVAEDGN